MSFFSWPWCFLSSTKYLDQTVPHCEGQGRPDIIILNEEAKKAYLVDVAVPWGSEENLKASMQGTQTGKLLGHEGLS